MQPIVINNIHQVKPTKIICVGRNYAAHTEELGNKQPQEMVLFCKPNSAISEILHASHQDEELDYEGELCLMVENGRFSALGFGFDLTKRGLQSQLKQQGLPWERAKAFDGSAVFSPFVSLNKAPQRLSFQLKRNNVTVQRGDSEFMLYQPDDILSEINSFMQLNNGDIVMTGTPKGVGVVAKGDQFTVHVKLDGKRVIEHDWLAV